MKNLILLLTVLTFLFSCKSNPKEEYDICIYGGFRRSNSSILCQDVG